MAFIQARFTFARGGGGTRYLLSSLWFPPVTGGVLAQLSCAEQGGVSNRANQKILPPTLRVVLVVVCKLVCVFTVERQKAKQQGKRE